MPRRSRYAQVGVFQADPLGRVEFRGLLPRNIRALEGQLEHTVLAGQRLDRLALDYFNHDRDWWQIADANAGFTCATDMVFERLPGEDDPLGREEMIGRTIVIPARED
jgi:hypothetical protein